MKRSNTMSVVSHDNLADLRQKVAFHEAGHATGIHFSNARQNLPPVFFQLIFQEIEAKPVNSLLSNSPTQQNTIAKIKGGRLIQSFRLAFGDLDHQTSANSDKQDCKSADDYRLAFETDIINLLIGPLAEAKYIALKDNEPFNQELLTVHALKYYGGDDDLAVIDDYLQSYSADKQKQGNILNQLLVKAFYFINDRANWQAITLLAHYILTSNKNRISCEEVAAILDDEYQN